MDHSITGSKLADLLELNCKGELHPKYLKCDNGPEFRREELDKWCFEIILKLFFPGQVHQLITAILKVSMGLLEMNV